MSIYVYMFCIMMPHILVQVESQRICESKCHEYSRIVTNSPKPYPHMAVWTCRDMYTHIPYNSTVILISDKFLVGSSDDYDIRYGLDASHQQIVFTSNDIHNVTKIQTHKLQDFMHFDANYVVLLQIDRILLDSLHRPACLFSRNYMTPYPNKFAVSVPVFDGTEFDIGLSWVEVSYDEMKCAFISNTLIKNMFCFNMSRTIEYSEEHPLLLQDYKPFSYLPNNYYITGFAITGLFYSEARVIDRYYSTISQSVDWIESQIWISDNDNCGISEMTINPVILHSQPTVPNEFPWHAALFRIPRIGGKEYICGGTLVHELMVVTAAHCTSLPTGTISHELLIIIMGKHDLDINSLDSRETRVTNVLVHSSYNRHNYENDIALLKLQTIMPYSTYIQPICLTSNRLLFENKIGILAGWGLKELNQRQPILSKGSFPIRSQSECRLNGNFPTPISSFVNENNFCAGYENGTSMCNGDSGGGLVFKINDKWFLRGIASVGVNSDKTGHCDPLALSLFTDVTQFYNWILDEMEKI